MEVSCSIMGVSILLFSISIGNRIQDFSNRVQSSWNDAEFYRLRYRRKYDVIFNIVVRNIASIVKKSADSDTFCPGSELSIIHIRSLDWNVTYILYDVIHITMCGARYTGEERTSLGLSLWTFFRVRSNTNVQHVRGSDESVKPRTQHGLMWMILH